jgi:hypothetical protein
MKNSHFGRKSFWKKISDWNLFSKKLLKFKKATFFSQLSKSQSAMFFQVVMYQRFFDFIGWMNRSKMKEHIDEKAVWGEYLGAAKTVFVDSAGAHTGDEISNYALLESNTTLRKFPTNATDLVQTLDVLLMKPLKRTHFQNIWDEYCLENAK